MKQLTVRGVPEDLSRALARERRRREQSLNATVIQLLRQALGLTPDTSFTNGLEAFAGTWSEDEHAEFERAVSPFNAVDEELWR